MQDPARTPSRASNPVLATPAARQQPPPKPHSQSWPRACAIIFICTAYRRALALFIVLTLLIGIYVRAQHTLQRAGGRRATGSARRAEKCRAADAPTQLASKLGAARTGFSTNTSTRVRATARELYTERRFLPPKCANRSCTLQNFTVN